MDRVRRPRIVGAEQDRGHEGAAVGAGRGFEIARDDPRPGGDELFDLAADVVALGAGDQGAHRAGLVARVADRHRLELLRDRDLDRVEVGSGDDRAADGSAFLSRLGGHLVDDFLDEQIELGRPRRGIGAKDRGVEAVLLGDELDRLALDDGMGLELERGACRAGEADHVLPGEMVEQVADPADDQLQRAIGEQPGVDHDPHRGFAQISGRAGRLDDGGHPREQGRGKLFEHAPHGEVEGVDVDRGAGHRRIDVLADEAAAFRQRLDRAVEQDVGVGELAAALRREAQQRASAALDVDPAVLARRAGEVVELVQFLLAREDGEPEPLDDPRAVVERQLAQGGAADGAGVIQHRREIDPARSGRRDKAAVDRADDIGAVAGARNPLVAGIIEQFGGFHGAVPGR